MRKILLTLALLPMVAFSQDTTWVQTFTFDSISTRRANFVFPEELNSKRFEKVLMYYKLKCDPATPWDQYDCGEWDYLAHTRVFEHTGNLDSIEYEHPYFLVNGQEQSDVHISSMPIYTVTSSNQDLLIIDNTISEASYLVGDGTATESAPFSNGNPIARTQFLLNASDLSVSGITSGDLNSMALNLAGASGTFDNLKIKMKSTSNATLTSFDNASGWQEMYLYNTDLVAGQNRINFLNPFNWDGTSNILVEVSYGHNSSFSLLTTEGTNVNDRAVFASGNDGYVEFGGANEHLQVPSSTMDFSNGLTVQAWVKYDGFNNWSRIIDFGNGPGADNILLANQGTSGNLVLSIRQGSSSQDLIANNVLQLNQWIHVAGTLDANGNAKLFVNGVEVVSGTLHMPITMERTNNYIGRSNWSNDGYFDGSMNELIIFNTALDGQTIQDWMAKSMDGTHPNIGNRLIHLSFDDEGDALTPVITNDAGNVLLVNKVGAVNQLKMDADAYYMDVEALSFVPEITFFSGNYDTHIETVTVSDSTVSPGSLVQFYEVIGNGVQSSSSEYGWEVPSAEADQSFTNSQLTYYGVPFEIINDIEIGRFITPYGINFDLGPNGFTWIYDITDYYMYFQDTVDLAAHNTQELIDLRFAFIEGVPPRDVHSRIPVWSEWRSHYYSNLDSDSDLSATDVVLSDTSEMFKIKTRFTGHGHEGNANCCEWDKKDHKISIDGVERFNWHIWEETACGDNPNISQGGTWPYAREGWCPGDLVKEYDHELTPFVAPGSTISVDYGIEPIPANDQGQGSGNYVMAFDLISYSAPNHQNDVAIVDILNPNNWEYYQKWNPSCQTPRVIIQNTGEQDLTSCTIEIWTTFEDRQSFQWTGNLKFLEKEVVEIPVNDLTFWTDYHGTSTFTARVVSVNGSFWPNVDDYSNNDVKTVKYDAPDFVNGPFLIWMISNNKAHENQYRLEDAQGNIIFENNNLSNTTHYKDTFDLDPGCYSLIVEDSDSDGMGFWYSSQVEGETSGTLRIKRVGGPIVHTLPRDFGNYSRYNFSVGFSVGLEEELINHEIFVFPNPNEGHFDVELSGLVGGDAEIEILDFSGRTILTQKMDSKETFATTQIDMSSAQSGAYLVKISTNGQVYTKTIIKK